MIDDPLADTRRLFARVADAEIELWAPDLVYAEIASALRKLVLRRFIEARAGELKGFTGVLGVLEGGGSATSGGGTAV